MQGRLEQKEMLRANHKSIEEINTILEQIVKGTLGENIVLTKNTQFGNGMVDSIQMVEIICMCEEIFEIQFEDEDLNPEKYLTYSDLLIKIQNLVNK